MNKIYKVVWNKARNCYVVGSEFISSTGKGCTVGVTRGAALRAAVLGVLLAGASMMPMVDTVQAADLTPKVTTDSQCIVYLADPAKQNANEITVDGSTYILTTYKIAEDDIRDFYVREGYTITGYNDGQFAVAHNSAYDETTSDKNLMFSYTQSLADGDQSSVYTANKQSGDLTAHIYGAASTSTTTEIALYQNNGKSEVVQYGDGEVKAIVSYTKEVEYDSSTGKYKLAGSDGAGTIDASYVYSISTGKVGDSNPTAKTYVFTTTENGSEVYTGTVYGTSGERIVTGTDGKGNMYSAWGTELDSSQVTAEEISIEKYVQNYNELSDRIHQNFQQLPKALTATNRL